MSPRETPYRETPYRETPHDSRRARVWSLAALALVGGMALGGPALVGTAAAQAPGEVRVLGGLGLGPGTGGFVAGTRSALTVFSQEAALYGDYTPRVVGGSGRLLVSVGVGGALRVLRIADVVGSVDTDRLDVDAGLRAGPSFFVSFYEQTAASRARSFRVMFDPFVRGSLRLANNRVVFVELGNQAPSLRGGLSVGLGG